MNAHSEITDPRPAAATILLRRSGKHNSRGLEILLVKRNPNARFMPAVWVFPGGAVDSSDKDVKEGKPFRRAALRELVEETAIDLGTTDALKPWSRWITPTEVQVRYDVRFYVALAPPHMPPKPDQHEVIEAVWFKPARALESYESGEIKLVFPTIKHLEELSTFASADDVLRAVGSRTMQPVQPRVITVDGQPRIVLPDEGSGVITS